MPPLASRAKKTRGVRSRPRTKQTQVDPLQVINPRAAGIDVGAESHFVAVPTGADPESAVTVREFPSFTVDLQAMVQWLKRCQVDKVAMESTGVYWIPLFDLLQREGLQPILVDARRTKNLACRKSDVSDCQWIQQLHSYGMLQGAFLPPAEMVTLRVMVRQRARLTALATSCTLRMQKALNQMNLQLQHVLADITGVTGLAILRKIVAGEKNPAELAKGRDRRCKSSAETIAKALQGNYLMEHVITLRMALQQWDLIQAQSDECSIWINENLKSITTPLPLPAELVLPCKRGRSKHTASDAAKDDLRSLLFSLAKGVDLTTIPGINDQTALVILSEIGPCVDAFHSARHFASWLGLCPQQKISGGKVLSSKTRPKCHPVTLALHLSASTLTYQKGALGNCFRRLCFRLGKPAAITAMAHKLARIVYSMLKHKTQYSDPDGRPPDVKANERTLRKIRASALKLGYQLEPMAHQQARHQPSSNHPMAATVT